MKVIIQISLIALLLVACRRQSSSETEVDLNNATEKIATTKEQVDRQSGSVDKSYTTKTAQPVQSKIEKIEQERLERMDATRRIIVQNQSIPSFQIDSMSNRFKEKKRFYFDTLCAGNTNEILGTYSIAFNDVYPNSSKNTGKEDGASFCLGSLVKFNIKNAIIVFGRNEGGHISDGVTLVALNDKLNKIYYLPLSYFTGKDGHETTVQSSIKNNIITRKIEERYGWTNMHPDSLNKQPRRVITQEIIIHKSGSMEILKENIAKFNLDENFN